MAPPPLAFMRRAAACEQKKRPSTFTSSTRSHAAREISRALLRTATPALLTRTSMRPSFSNAAATAFSSLTSTRSSPSSGSMSSRTTEYPWAANRSAVALPMPRAAPVTTTVLPVGFVFSMVPLV